MDIDFCRAVLEDFPLCVVVTDRSGRVLFLNRAGEAMLGYSASEVVGGSVGRLRASGRHESAMLEIEETLRRGRWAGEVRVRHKDGEVFPAQAAWSVVRSADAPDRPQALVLVIRDLSRDRLREKRLVREARERSVGQLAGRVAHEFNNLFAGLTSAAEVALSSESQPRMRRALQQCLGVAERGARVTHLLRLLALERHPAAQRIELDRLIEHLLGALAGRAEGQGVEVRRDLQAAPPVLAEVGLIEQALSAVLENALEAMPRGGRLTVSLTRLHTGAVLAVEDSGPGVSPEVQERLFEPFVTTKPRDLGEDVGMEGLGLALARRIVEDLGGQIDLTSRPNEGTVVVMTFPGAPAEPVPPAAPAAAR